MEFFKKIIEMLISKKKIIGWVASAGFAIGAAKLGMETKEFKDAVCSVEIAQPLKDEAPKPIEKIEVVKPETK